MRDGLTRGFVVFSIVMLLSVSAQATPPKIDFNGDGRADLFLRNLYTGDLAAWLVNGSRLLQAVSYGTVAPSAGWIPLAPGDFNGDGRTDLLWYNGTTGSVGAWLLNGGTILQAASYGTMAPSAGVVPIDVGDFNGDGRTDLLWYNSQTGSVGVWLLNGGSILQAASYGRVSPDAGWTLIGTGDFNGDGRTDLLWYSHTTGDFGVWLLNGGTILQAASYGRMSSSADWIPIGTGDFNGDGRADLLWHNHTTGSVGAWLLNGGTILQTASYGTITPKAGWTLMGTDDFNGDGRADLLWYNVVSSATVTWLLEGTRTLQSLTYANLPSGSVWQVHIPR